jgi:hypothetical protein
MLAATQDISKTAVTITDEADDDDDNEESKEKDCGQSNNERNISGKQTVAQKRKKCEAITSRPNKFVKYDKFSTVAEGAVGEDDLDGSKMNVSGSENMETSSCTVAKATGRKGGRSKTASDK